MIQPICSFCREELIELGALLFSPPDRENNTKKSHLCVSCYERIIGVGYEIYN